jgi:hypothetical protein
VACINESGTYTVLWNGSGSAAAVEVGGAGSGVQTFEINGGNFPTTEDNDVASGGVLSLVPTSSTAADITGGSNTITVDAGGTLTSSGSTQQANIGLPLDNQGAVTLGAATTIASAAVTNEGSGFTVSSGASFTASGSPFTDASGSLNVDGSFTVENAFTQSGATETGNPALVEGTFVDSAGTGAFTAVSTIEGTIPAGQTVTDLAATDPIGTQAQGVTVQGTLICEAENGTVNINSCSFEDPNNTYPGITVASGGTLETTGPGIKSECEQACVNLSTNLQIDGGGTLSVENADTLFGGGGDVLTSAGTVQVTSSGWLNVSGCVSFGSSGTVGVTVGSSVAAPLGTIQDDVCPDDPFDISGTLAVTTDGASAGGTVIAFVGGPGVSGTFGTFAFGPDYYTVSYGGGGAVGISPATPFSATATSFSAAEGEAVTTPQVATFDTNSEPGTYSATVNYGDGTGTQVAMVNLSGTSGTVTGPTHTYVAPGTYPVTTVISTTAGTTITVSESISVTGPTITGFSVTRVRPGRSISTTVKGTNFDGTGAASGFTTSDPTELSVATVTFHAATRRTAATYTLKLKAATGAHREKVSITLTQTGTEAGTTTATSAITIK